MGDDVAEDSGPASPVGFAVASRRFGGRQVREVYDFDNVGVFVLFGKEAVKP